MTGLGVSCPLKRRSVSSAEGKNTNITFFKPSKQKVMFEFIAFTQFLTTVVFQSVNTPET